MNPKENKVTSMRVYKPTLERFNNFGKKNQNSDNLLNQMMDVYEACMQSGTASVRAACHSIDDAFRPAETIPAPVPTPVVSAPEAERVRKIEELMMKGFDMDEACRQVSGKKKRNVYFDAVEKLLRENMYEPTADYVGWLRKTGRYAAWARGIEGLRSNLHKQGVRPAFRAPA